MRRLLGAGGEGAIVIAVYDVLGMASPGAVRGGVVDAEIERVIIRPRGDR